MPKFYDKPFDLDLGDGQIRMERMDVRKMPFRTWVRSLRKYVPSETIRRKFKNEFCDPFFDVLTHSEIYPVTPGAMQQFANGTKGENIWMGLAYSGDCIVVLDKDDKSCIPFTTNSQMRNLIGRMNPLKFARFVASQEDEGIYDFRLYLLKAPSDVVEEYLYE